MCVDFSNQRREDTGTRWSMRMIRIACGTTFSSSKELQISLRKQSMQVQNVMWAGKQKFGISVGMLRASSRCGTEDTSVAG